MKATRDVIEVKKYDEPKTTPEVFRAMVDYIYAGHPKKVLYKIMSPKTICEFYALGDYYDIPNLKKEILDSLGPPWDFDSPRFEITRENLIYTATVARSYSKLFPDLGTQLMMKCLKFYLESRDKNFPEATDDVLHELLEFGKSTLQLSGEHFFGEHITSSLTHFCRLGYPGLFHHRRVVVASQSRHDPKT